jgi:lipopolysaccharide export system protein LptC
VLSARQAIQANSSQPIVDVRDMNAQLELQEGPARLEAGRARYNMDADQVDVLGPIQFNAADGYQLNTSDVSVDLKGRSLASNGRVAGQMPLGRFSAERMEVDLADRKVVLTGRARLHIVQGGVR